MPAADTREARVTSFIEPLAERSRSPARSRRAAEPANAPPRSVAEIDLSSNPSPSPARGVWNVASASKLECRKSSPARVPWYCNPEIASHRTSPWARTFPDHGDSGSRSQSARAPTSAASVNVPSNRGRCSSERVPDTSRLYASANREALWISTPEPLETAASLATSAGGEERPATSQTGFRSVASRTYRSRTGSYSRLTSRSLAVNCTPISKRFQSTLPPLRVNSRTSKSGTSGPCGGIGILDSPSFPASICRTGSWMARLSSETRPPSTAAQPRLVEIRGILRTGGESGCSPLLIATSSRSNESRDGPRSSPPIVTMPPEAAASSRTAAVRTRSPNQSLQNTPSRIPQPTPRQSPATAPRRRRRCEARKRRIMAHARRRTRR